MDIKPTVENYHREVVIEPQQHKSFRKIRQMKNILLVLIFLTLQTFTFGQKCLPNLKDYSTPFDKIEASSFKFFNNKLDEVSIVGLGEDKYGTSEFTNYHTQK